MSNGSQIIERVYIKYYVHMYVFRSYITSLRSLGHVTHKQAIWLGTLQYNTSGILTLLEKIIFIENNSRVYIYSIKI